MYWSKKDRVKCGVDVGSIRFYLTRYFLRNSVFASLVVINPI